MYTLLKISRGVTEHTRSVGIIWGPWPRCWHLSKCPRGDSPSHVYDSPSNARVVPITIQFFTHSSLILHIPVWLLTCLSNFSVVASSSHPEAQPCLPESGFNLLCTLSLLCAGYLLQFVTHELCQGSPRSPLFWPMITEQSPFFSNLRYYCWFRKKSS